MRVTAKTKYTTIAGIEKYLKDDTIKAIKQAAEAQYGSMYDLPFATFYACSNGDFSEVLGNVSNPTVLQVYWCKRFGDFVEEFTRSLKPLTIRQTAEEQQAAAGMVKTDWGEGMLVFIRNYFGLPSFKAAEQITMGEILIAKRAQYNQDIFARNLSNLRVQKFKKK